MDDIYQEAINHFGPEIQTLKAAEELSELSAALIKHEIEGTPDTLDRVYEELADVRIMLNQLERLFPSAALMRWQIKKMQRLRAILEKK